MGTALTSEQLLPLVVQLAADPVLFITSLFSLYVLVAVVASLVMCWGLPYVAAYHFAVHVYSYI